MPPIYKPGIDIESVAPQHRYLYEELPEEPSPPGQSPSSISYKDIVAPIALVAICGYFAWAIFTHPDSYVCNRGRCGHGHAAGLICLAIIAVVAWTGVKSLRAFMRRQPPRNGKKQTNREK